VATPDEWRSRRHGLLAQFHQWVIGSVPPAPAVVGASVLAEPGCTVREVKLTFGRSEPAA